MKTVYLDYNATTPIDPQVLSKMLPYFEEHFGNPASSIHQYGWLAEEAVQKSRKQVASFLNASPQEIIFTSGATESNNWVLRGFLETFKNEKIHLISSPVEHNSVLNAFIWASQQPQVEVSWAPVNKFGQVLVDEVKKLIRPTTKLMSFMWVNNEIASINPMKELVALAKENKIYFHSDATQAIGKLPVSLEEIPIDLLSFSGHKFYGPKGIGGLYIRSKNPTVQIAPLFLGGGQERGLRSGTLNVPGIVGLGETCALSESRLPHETLRLEKLRNLLEKLLFENFPEIQINGHPTERSPNTLNVTFKNHTIPDQIAAVAISRGSACHSNSDSLSFSHVLKAIGLSEHDARKTLRLSIGSRTTESEIYYTVECFKKTISIQRD